MSFIKEEQDTIHAKIASIIDTYFARVKNKERLTQLIVAFLQKNKVNSGDFSGDAHQRYIKKAIRKMVRDDNSFSEQRVERYLTKALASISKLEERLRSLSTSLPTQTSIVSQLKKKGFVEFGSEVEDEDITALCTALLPEDKCLPPIGLAYNADKVVEMLRDKKNHQGPLLLAVTINQNHWILLNCVKDESGVHIHCWDPLSDSSTVNAVTAQIKQIAEDVYGSTAPISVEYEFAKQQHDGFSCGYHVMQEMLRRCGIDNEFTRVDPRDTQKLCFEFVKLLRQVVGGDNLESDTAMDDQGTVYSTKETDEFFAIALQEVYRTAPELDDNAAIDRAKTALQETSLQDLIEKKREVINWVTQYYNKNYSENSRLLPFNCRQEAQVELPEERLPSLVS